MPGPFGPKVGAFKKLRSIIWQAGRAIKGYRRFASKAEMHARSRKKQCVHALPQLRLGFHSRNISQQKWQVRRQGAGKCHFR